jgi:hypothetical protein
MPGTKTSEKSWETRSRSANEMEAHETRRTRPPAVSTESDRRQALQPFTRRKSQPDAQRHSPPRLAHCLDGGLLKIALSSVFPRPRNVSTTCGTMPLALNVPSIEPPAAVRSMTKVKTSWV